MLKKPSRDGYITREEFFAFVKQVDRRFEQVDRRFEQVDRRFEQVLGELKAQREEMKAQREEMKAQRLELQDQRHWTEVVVGGFQRRAGRNLEDMVAGCLRVALDMTGIRKEALKLRQKLLDEKGEIGPPGREYEIDLCASNGKAFLFEIKSTAKPDDVARFADKAELAARKWGLTEPGRVFVTLEKSGEIEEACLRHGVTLA